jgi:sigma54-dependent transcription regulator
MPKAATVKIGPEIDKKLYVQFSRVAKENGQSVRFVLERAMENYLQFVAPSQSVVRPEAMAHFRRSTDKNRKLHELLAKS